MKKLLHIDSSVLGPHSVSRQLSAAIVDRLRQTTPDIQMTYRDLSATPLTHLSGAHLAAAQGATNPDAALAQELAAGQAVLEEFLAADTVVLGAPMYNFTLPSQLKAWIDRIVVAGKTFKYDAQGPKGLAGDKRVIVAISRGEVDQPQRVHDADPDRAAHPVLHGRDRVQGGFHRGQRVARLAHSRDELFEVTALDDAKTCARDQQQQGGEQATAARPAPFDKGDDA